ncbi:MAG: PilN domain-containing protein [Planctomycetes bacterium]|nr:PilN domain-containing protein [Planctomycetota bacterium]
MSIHNNDLTISKISQKFFRFTLDNMIVRDFFLKDTLDLKPLIAAKGFQGQDIILSWPREKTIVRELELPGSSINELKESISYQLDSFILYTESDVYYDVYTSISHEYGERAFVFAIKREELDELMTKLDSLNIKPNRIIISSLAFIPFVNNSKAIILSNSPGFTTFDCYDGHTLVKSSLIRDSADLSETVHEIKPDKLISLGTYDIDNLGIDIAELPLESWERSKESLGAALHGVSEYLDKFDVLKLSKKNIISKFLLTGMLILAIISFAVIIPGIIKHKKSNAINSISQQLRALQPEVAAVSKIREEADEVLEKSKKISNVTNITRRRIDLLAELTRVLPDDAWIKQVSMKDNYFQIEGSGLSGTTVLTLLEKSPLFSQVKFTSSVTKGRDGKEKFKIEVNIENDENPDIK